jgi:hypothetical protein
VTVLGTAKHSEKLPVLTKAEGLSTGDIGLLDRLDKEQNANNERTVEMFEQGDSVVQVNSGAKGTVQSLKGTRVKMIEVQWFDSGKIEWLPEDLLRKDSALACDEAEIIFNVIDLAMMIRRLHAKLKKHAPDDPILSQALDLLEKQGIKSSPLR